ncbi:hypothetical protein PWT90_01516 [Aphanocladium album]|nr:hypothetical protein PWT90_01516 [Aphanocladium album]
MKIAAIIAAGILPAAIAIPSSKYVVHEKHSTDQFNRVKGDAAHAATVVPARIALKQSNLEKGHNLIMEIDETISSVKQWLVEYSVPEDSIKNDITIGDQSCGRNCGTEGFAATRGWDLVTGLGTPNFKPRRDFFMELP